MIDTEGRNPSTKHICQWFDYDHLSGTPRTTSEMCSDLADNMLELFSDSPELTAGLRKLLEAKDCFVRCAVATLDEA